jgi:glycosyltransferase involved in cell wall biosynthesis
MEVLIADGESTDSTRAVIASLAARYPAPTVAILENPGRFVSPGLNAALAAARGDIVVRIDGHTILERGMCANAWTRCFARARTT